MGITWSKLWDMFDSTKEYQIAMVGLDGAGKTTILYKLKKNRAIDTVPTIGFNTERIELSENVSMTLMDVGGQDRIRNLWKHYYEGCSAVIFVVDSSDKKRFDTAKKEWDRILAEPLLKDAVIIIFANKQDVKSAASVLDVANALDLQSLANTDRKWFIQGTCATTGDGIWAGIHWLAAHL